MPSGIIQDFEEEGIQVLHGRYGPYVTDKAKNARVPKDREPKSLTLEECKDIVGSGTCQGQARQEESGEEKS